MKSLVLLSGGLDSAVLVAHLAREGRVTPVYVGVGLAWEAAERAMLAALLARPPFDAAVAPLESVRFDMRDVYAPTHWAVTGDPPAYDTPDEDVYLAGRNLVLLTKAGVIAAARRLPRIALGPLAGNPFPDARPAFFSSMAAALTLGLDHPVEVVAPFAGLKKEEVIRLGAELGVPMALTLSCMRPGFPGSAGPLGSSGSSGSLGSSGSFRSSGSSGSAGSAGSALPVHCGLCSKCRERRDAFAAAGVDDPTPYANPAPR